MKVKLTILCLIIASFVFIGWSSKDEALVKTVNQGKTAEVQNLLEQGVNPNIRVAHGQTLLMIAVQKGYLSIAKLLLENGANIAAVDHNGKTAILLARETQQVEMVKFLNDWRQTALKQNPTPVPSMDESSAPPVIENTPTPAETPAIAEPETPPPAPAVSATPEPATAETAETLETSSEPVKDKMYPSVRTFFEFNQAGLKPEDVEKLNGILPVLKDNLKLYIILGGHADEVGTFKNSLVLSRRRAEAVKQFLVSAGIVGDRVIIYAYGKEHPAKRGHDDAAKAFNRRVDVVTSEVLLSAGEMLARTVE